MGKQYSEKVLEIADPIVFNLLLKTHIKSAAWGVFFTIFGIYLSLDVSEDGSQTIYYGLVLFGIVKAIKNIYLAATFDATPIYRLIEESLRGSSEAQTNLHTDDYTTLECTPDSSNEEIKKSFRKLAHKYHPDKPSNSNNPKHFIKISQAYERIKRERKME